ncbi:FAD-binding oxidoreductase [Haploplasma modicum]|uniref:FAD-binding oxidoreductase n=1 Tax=Haploplasma modicum TaxID=2150 RepID=UPI00054E89AF|nr:FAD-binding oxidoreductase [Haploplasma modicum]
MKDLILDNARIFLSGSIPEKYTFSYYMNVNTNIKAVFLPINTDEISKIVKYCYDNNIKFIPQASGTGAVGGQFNVLDGVVIIDMSLMDNILDVNLDTMTITVEPGVKLGTIQNLLEDTNFFYPPDPGSKDSSIGGNVSTNAGGMRAIKYGTTRNYVKELEIVLPDGRKTVIGGLTVKDASGYDLKDLFIGSEGTLGIVTKIKLRIIPRPKYNKSLILAFDKTTQAALTVTKILNSGYLPTALELFDKETIEYSEKYLNTKFPSQMGHSYVLSTFDGMDEKAIDLILEEIMNKYKVHAKEIILLNKDQAKTAWQLRDNILYALMSLTKYEMLDEVVPIHHFAEMISYTKELEKKYHTTILNFGHAGDGNIHTLLLQENKTDEQWNLVRKNILDDLYTKVYELGGLISAEHGIGYIKRDYFLKHTDKVKVEIMRSIKKALDPKGLLNPNKVI